MYLKQLYQQHKGWFLFVVLFIAGQLFINFKRGAVFSPFYHYGMYSEKMNLTDSLGVYRITVNNRYLQPFDYSAQTWDKLTLPLDNFGKAQHYNSAYYHGDVQRLLEKLHAHSTEDNFGIPAFNFSDWYKGYVESVIGEKVGSISYSFVKYPIQQFTSHSKPTFSLP